IAPGGIVTGLSLNLVPRNTGLPAGRYFGTLPSTVALWTFNAYDAVGRIADQGPYGFHLSPDGPSIPVESSPYGAAALFNGDGRRFSVPFNSAFTVAGTGR